MNSIHDFACDWVKNDNSWKFSGAYAILIGLHTSDRNSQLTYPQASYSHVYGRLQVRNIRSLSTTSAWLLRTVYSFVIHCLHGSFCHLSGRNKMRTFKVPLHKLYSSGKLNVWACVMFMWSNGIRQCHAAYTWPCFLHLKTVITSVPASTERTQRRLLPTRTKITTDVITENRHKHFEKVLTEITSGRLR